MPRGNVLFITVDQWRGDCLSTLSHPVVRTPTLDDLASRGVLFSSHWANTAPCGPSRATLYTGMYAMNHRSVLNGTPLDDRFTNVARLARAAGYDPVLFGYTDTSVDPRTVGPDDPGLRTYEGPLPGFTVAALLDESKQLWGRWLAEQGYDVPSNPVELYGPQTDYPDADEHGASWAPTRFAAEHSETAFLVERLLSWFDQAGDEPWFVHASFIRPHPPYRNPVGYHDRYSADDGPPFRGCVERSDEQLVHPLPAVALNVPGVGCPVDERDRRQQRATYWGAMAEVDDQLARLFTALADGGHLRDTLVVLTSDHGEQAGDHWLVQKLGYWDQSYRVPLIVVDPRGDADGTRGSVVDAVTEHVDVLPTICDWIGVETPVQCDGRSLRPFVVDDEPPPDDWRSEAHWEWDFRDPATHLGEDILGIRMQECSLSVLRGDRWKYVHFAGPPTVLPPLLFDLETDPDETRNLAADPAHAAVVAECAQGLLSWRMRHADRTLTGHLLTPDGLVVRRDPIR